MFSVSYTVAIKRDYHALTCKVSTFVYCFDLIACQLCATPCAAAVALSFLCKIIIHPCHRRRNSRVGT